MEKGGQLTIIDKGKGPLNFFVGTVLLLLCDEVGSDTVSSPR